MENEWSFLDEFNGNIVYAYVQSLKNSRFETPYPVMQQTTERDKFNEAEKRKKVSLYIFWFVYRYLLNCETLEQALNYANEKTLQDYKLLPHLSSNGIRKIYIGVYGNEIYLDKIEDVKIILEIIYKRYDMFKQLECCFNLLKTNQKVKKNYCKKTIKRCKEFLEREESKEKM